MKTLSLSGSDWTVTGYWQHQWRFAKDGDLGQSRRVPVPTVSATVPGAVHADLLAAGLIPDWQDGLNAEQSEWVNNREWIYRKRVTVPTEWGDAAQKGPKAIALECDGLDYSGLVFVDGKEVGAFEGTHIRHHFDLTGVVQPGQTFDLEILFHLSPQIEGVFGYTSKTRVFKPRFGYCWDWCPRVVNVGIWQDVRLVQRGPAQFEHVRVRTAVAEDLQSGRVRVVGQIAGKPATVRYRLVDAAGAAVASGEQAVGVGVLDLRIPVECVKLWWPGPYAGEDEPCVNRDRPDCGRAGSTGTYVLHLELCDETGCVSDAIVRTVGFRRVRWLDNPTAPQGAKPYLCEVNGRPIFLRGINWVPLSPFYGTVTRERYETVLQLYRNMNVNIIRVWGGAILETEVFYETCDRLGLMVWQELPLSSSGIENWPPEDPAVIEHLQTIATEYVERRGHHPSHVLWCGGNELQGNSDGGKVGIGKPVDELHPLMARWQDLLATIDPGKRFQATSPSGPSFYAHADNLGKGIHWQVHGPWGWGDVPFAKWYEYWNRDDSLFRSENGVPGCSSVAALERHKGGCSLWPPRDSNRHWLVPAAAWIPWDDVVAAFGPIADEPGQLPTVVKAHRYMQAESYRYAAETCRRRFPTCSGYIVWMGHDNLHNTSNNSVIQIDGSTKPAYDLLQRAYAPRHVSLRHERLGYLPGERFTGQVFAHSDDGEIRGTLTVRLRRLDGEVFEAASSSADAGPLQLDWTVSEFRERLFLVDVSWDADGPSVQNRYLLSQQCEHPLQPLLGLAAAHVVVRRESEDRILVSNEGPVAAIGVRLVSQALNWAVLTSHNGLLLLPGESQVLAFRLLRLEPGVLEMPQLAVEWLNQVDATQV